MFESRTTQQHLSGFQRWKPFFFAPQSCICSANRDFTFSRQASYTVRKYSEFTHQMPGSQPSISVEELREIDKRSKGNEDVRRLLWEIKRLRDENEQLKQNVYRDHGIIARCYQISRSIPESWKGGVIGTLMDDLKKQLEGHPVREHQDSIMPALRGYDLNLKPGDDD